MAVTEGAVPEAASGDVVYRVENLVKMFPIKSGFLGSLFGPEQYVHAVDGVSFDIREGEILGVVGESGCGKTTTARLLVRLETPTSGHMFFRDVDIASLNSAELKEYRRKVQMKFQDPYEAVDP